MVDTSLDRLVRKENNKGIYVSGNHEGNGYTLKKPVYILPSNYLFKSRLYSDIPVTGRYGVKTPNYSITQSPNQVYLFPGRNDSYSTGLTVRYNAQSVGQRVNAEKAKLSFKY